MTNTDATAPRAASIQAANDFLLLSRCYLPDADDGHGHIVLPNKTKSDGDRWAVVESVGPKCKYFGPEDVGCYVYCEELRNGQFGLGDGLWMAREGLFDFKLTAEAPKSA